MRGAPKDGLPRLEGGHARASLLHNASYGRSGNIGECGGEHGLEKPLADLPLHRQDASGMDPNQHLACLWLRKWGSLQLELFWPAILVNADRLHCVSYDRHCILSNCHRKNAIYSCCKLVEPMERQHGAVLHNDGSIILLLDRTNDQVFVDRVFKRRPCWRD